MPTDATPEPDRSPARQDALAAAMAELQAERAPMPGEPAERYWLRAGIALGLSQPGRAALLLAGLEAGTAATTAVTPDARLEAAAATTEATAVDGGGAAAEADLGTIDDGAGPAAEDTAADPNEVPVRSLLLARSAALPASTPAATVFGWVAQLTPYEIRRLGLVVTDLLAGGAPRDLERGFALAWSAGAHLPREDLRGLFTRFSELELAVCSVLGGRDLLSIVRSPETGVGAMLSAIVRRPDPAGNEASMILDREGDAGRRALVAIWNAWVALRYRDLIAPPLFEQLVQVWVAVVGRVPEA